MNLESADYVSLSEFPLAWRFTDPKYNVLPDQDLRLISVFSAGKAREIWKFAEMLWNAKLHCRSNVQFITKIETDDDELTVQSWLLKRPSDPNAKVLVSWDPEIAATLPFDVFCRYWSDFCYPSSDDVVVWPMTRAWVLYYDHEEEFSFGTVTDSAWM